MSSIPQALLEEWRIFEELDPDLDERLDWGLAHIVQNIARNGKPLSDFMLPFGDYVKPSTIVQPVAYQEMLLDAWIHGSNEVFKAKEERRK